MVFVTQSTYPGRVIPFPNLPLIYIKRGAGILSRPWELAVLFKHYAQILAHCSTLELTKTRTFVHISGCGVSHNLHLSRIMGGRDAGYGQFPWTARITISGPGPKKMCAGTLVRDRSITAQRLAEASSLVISRSHAMIYMAPDHFGIPGILSQLPIVPSTRFLVYQSHSI